MLGALEAGTHGVVLRTSSGAEVGKALQEAFSYFPLAFVLFQAANKSSAHYEA